MPLYLRLILLSVPASAAEATASGHDAQVAQLRADGKLLCAGRLRNGEGWLEVFRAIDLHDAERIAQGSPLVAEGLGTWILRELDRFEE